VQAASGPPPKPNQELGTPVGLGHVFTVHLGQENPPAPGAEASASAPTGHRAGSRAACFAAARPCPPAGPPQSPHSAGGGLHRSGQGVNNSGWVSSVHRCGRAARRARPSHRHGHRTPTPAALGAGTWPGVQDRPRAGAAGWQPGAVPGLRPRCRDRAAFQSPAPRSRLDGGSGNEFVGSQPS